MGNSFGVAAPDLLLHGGLVKLPTHSNCLITGSDGQYLGICRDSCLLLFFISVAMHSVMTDNSMSRHVRNDVFEYPLYSAT